MGSIRTSHHSSPGPEERWGASSDRDPKGRGSRVEHLMDQEAPAGRAATHRVAPAPGARDGSSRWYTGDASGASDAKTP